MDAGFNDKWLKTIFLLAFSIFSVFDFQRFGFEEHQVFAVIRQPIRVRSPHMIISRFCHMEPFEIACSHIR
jgi:hypothetical protein